MFVLVQTLILVLVLQVMETVQLLALVVMQRDHLARQVTVLILARQVIHRILVHQALIRLLVHHLVRPIPAVLTLVAVTLLVVATRQVAVIVVAVLVAVVAAVAVIAAAVALVVRVADVDSSQLEKCEKGFVIELTNK